MDNKNLISLQRLASNPNYSIWVEASAGSGKTTILINRLLRFALYGVKPQTIITLTYTKTAAAEIRERLYNELVIWMDYDDAQFNKNYLFLTGSDAKKSIQELRLNLFEFEKNIYDVNIHTFHAYCISLLYKFPLEAEIPPDFLLNSEEQTNSILFEAESNILSYALKSSKYESKLINANLVKAYNIISINGLYNSLNKYLREVARKRFMLKSDHFDIKACLNTLINNVLKWDIFSSSVQLSEFNKILNTFHPSTSDWKLKKSVKYGNDSNPNSLAQELIKDFNYPSGESNTEYFLENLFSLNIYFCYWTSEKNPLAKIISFHYSDDNNKGINNLSNLPNYIIRQIDEYSDQISKKSRKKGLTDFFILEYKYFSLCSAYFTVCDAFLEEYSDIKTKRGQIDYEDIISLTCKLLEDKNDLVPWVMYKLDYEINHILIDEAQDTSPRQWQIIIALVKQILLESENTNNGIQRSLFVVGDYKQSIYSFQGANPDSFIECYNSLNSVFKLHNQELRKIELGINYRSSQVILDFVDNLFNSDTKIGENMGISKWLNHRSANPSLTGKITVIKTTKPTTTKTVKKQANSGQAFEDKVELSLQLANSGKNVPEVIAKQIDNHCNILVAYLKNNNLPLESILTLLPRRSKIQSPLSRTLYRNNIQQAGNDIINVDSDGAVLDLIMAYTCSLNIFDDYTLACVLRSPFIEISEQELFSLLYNKKTPLYKVLIESDKYKDICSWLDNISLVAKNNSIFASLNLILSIAPPVQKPKLSSDSTIFSWSGMQALLYRFGEQSRDSLDTLLNIALEHDSQAESPQYFLNLFNTSSQTKKRELDANESHGVRIMTVHAAKGIEAPIVILPDLDWPSSASLGLDIILWNKGIPIPKLIKEFQTKTVANFIDANNALKYKEALRILYVALTRAKQELIFIYEESKEKANTIHHKWSIIIDNYICKAGFKLEKENADFKIFCFGSTVTQKPLETANKSIILPKWIENSKSRKLTKNSFFIPSSKLIDDDSFNKGNIIHSILLSIDLLYGPYDSSNRTESNTRLKIEKLIEFKYNDLDSNLGIEYINEIIKVIYNKDLKLYFPSIYNNSQNSELEKIFVEQEWITSYSKNNNSHSILKPDRICIFKDSLWIIDYKTHNKPPREVSNVPKSIIKQMKTYNNFLANSYPHKKINNLIVWTVGPIVMDITSSI